MAQYNRPQATSTGSVAQFGHVGKWSRVEQVTGQLICTGSAYGVGAVLVATGGAGSLTGSAGGTMDLADIADLGVIEVGPQEINVTGGTVYALYRISPVI